MNTAIHTDATASHQSSERKEARKNSPDESLKIATKPPQGVGYMLEKGEKLNGKNEN